MRKKVHKLLVTCGAGFIGSEFVRQGLKKGFKIVVVDKLTYAGDLQRLKDVRARFKFYKADICHANKIKSILNKEKPDAIVHFAAETHVDRSILNAKTFIETNVKGTQILLDLARMLNSVRFIHISTDEVYGDIKKGKFTESSPLRPNSPYAASKASADCLIRSYIRTFNFPAIIIRPSNNYGPWQYPEKFIPVAIYKAIIKSKIPVYGRGLNKREWLHVSDCVEAVFLILEKGKIGSIYNVGSNYETKNIDLAKKILKALGKKPSLIQFVKDRPGHDFRYALNFARISRLGWQPTVDIEKGILETVLWYSRKINWLTEKVSFLSNYWEKIYKS